MAAESSSLARDTAAIAREFAPLSARRMLAIGGILLILVGMLLGNLFAVFVLHQNASRINARLLAATQAIAIGDTAGVGAAFQDIGGFLENRGTKVDAHSHMIAFGYIALLLALLQPWIFFSERGRRLLAEIFLFGAWLLPVGVFLIHYVGLAGSPFAAIGWASVAADFGGLLVAFAVACELFGLWRNWRSQRATTAGDTQTSRDELLNDRSWSSRALLAGGTLLTLAGFAHGAYYAAFHLYDYEAQDATLVSQMASTAASGQAAATEAALNSYAQLQGAKAVNVAAHAHIIEFGILCVLMALFQPYVFLTERWRRTSAVILLAGSLILPVFVLLEMSLGLLAGGMADFGGLLVILALCGMLAGIVRYTGRLDATIEARP